METEGWVSLLGTAATLMVVLVGLLNFSVFTRQLKASREQLENARLQLENAQQQPMISLVQRAMEESSEHIKVLIERPHLRPYFYENQPLPSGDRVREDEIKLIAEFFLNTFASSLIHAATFPQYPVRMIEQTVRFHLGNSQVMRDYLLEAFDRFPVSGLAMLALKSGNKAAVERDLEQLIADAPSPAERERRAGLLQYVRELSELEPLSLTRYTFSLVR